jgi:hypothetical protein
MVSMTRLTLFDASGIHLRPDDVAAARKVICGTRPVTRRVRSLRDPGPASPTGGQTRHP